MTAALILACFSRTTDAGTVIPPMSKADAASPAYRVPVDVTWLNKHAWVANSRTGTLSCVDTGAQTVIREWKVAKSLSSVAVFRNHLLATDDVDHSVICLQPASANGTIELHRIADVRLAQYPVDIAVNGNQTTVAISSLWSHRVTLLKPDNNSMLAVTSTIDLPFAPRRLQFLSERVLVVADAFGGRLQVVDTTSGAPIRDHEVFGHNIRGIATNPQTGLVLLTCQTLNEETFTSYERIFWGVVMQNGLHSIPLASLTSESNEVSASSGIEAPVEFQPSSYGANGSAPGDYGSSSTGNSNLSAGTFISQRQYPLGTPSLGSGDPGDIVVTKKDSTLLLVSGVNQVAFRMASHLPFERLKTGRRPEAICLNDAESQAAIVNRFDDSMTIVSLSQETPQVTATIPLGAVRELSMQEQGEQQFYDARVSLDGWYSCHSCHTDGHTNGMRADTFGDEDRGAPKQVISLRGVSDSDPWAWNGSKNSLEDQIRTSLIISMQTQLTEENLPIDTLAAFMRSLAPIPSISEARGTAISAHQRTRLWKTFETVGCIHCHSGDTLTSDVVVDVGLHDEMGEAAFNPPSLRGVSQRSRFFHDGRASSLDDVLRSSHHDAENPLKEPEIRDLKQLLESL
ncbi:MAG: cytochrome c peroxidase [Planctomycetota bacterium]